MHLLSTPWKVLVTDDAYFADPTYEQENFVFLDKVLPGDGSVFVDIGAHHGLHSTFLARKAGETGLVYAFEPNPRNVRYLAYNTSFKAGVAPVVVFPVALADGPSTSMLQCWENERPLHTAMCQLTQGAERGDSELPVPVRTLDSFQLPHVDYIKMDVEHWEYKVLLGGQQTVLRDRPQMLIEIHCEETRQQIRDWASSHRYTAEHRHAHVHSVHTKSEYLYLKPE